jgi:hypothetical protein
MSSGNTATNSVYLEVVNFFVSIVARWSSIVCAGRDAALQ